jgi:hypothetical protein
MDVQKALDQIEKIPGCLSACLLTAKGEVVIGKSSSIRPDSVRTMLIQILKTSRIFKKNYRKHVLHGITIIDNQKKIVTRYSGRSSNRVLLALELVKDAKEHRIKLMIYSLFEAE